MGLSLGADLLFAHIPTTIAPVVAREAVDSEPIWRRPDDHASIGAAMARSRCTHFPTDDFAAQETGDRAEVERGHRFTARRGKGRGTRPAGEPVVASALRLAADGIFWISLKVGIDPASALARRAGVCFDVIARLRLEARRSR